MKYLKLLIILLILVHFKNFGQEFKRPEIDLNDFINKLAPIQTENINYDDLYENLFTLYQSPLDLNRADISELRNLLILSEIQINAILNHKKKFGPFLSIYELQSIPELNLDAIRTILPFVTVKNTWGSTNFSNFRRMATEHYLVFRADQTIEQSKGFAEEKYLGNRQRLYTRYRMSHRKDFSIGFISEKDAGEKSFFDYSTFHLQIQNKSIIKNLVIGDYLVQFGQGLIFSAGFAPGKGSEPIYTTRRSNLGIRPYNSLLENGSLRGIASTISINPNVEITALVSQNKRDASAGQISDDQEEYFSSILTSGFHRTENEILNAKAIKENNIGLNLLYKIPNLQFGFSALQTTFDQKFQKRDLPYNAFEFTGDKNFIFGPNFSFSWQNFNFFGEAARSTSGGMGFTTGLVGALGPKVEWSLNFRDYDKNFHTFYGFAFSEGSRSINEKGVYNGLKFIVKKGLEISGFYDSFSSPWLRYRVDAPSSGHDYQLRILWKPNKIFSQWLAWHHEAKQLNSSDDKEITRTLLDTKRDNLVFVTDYLWKQKVRFQSRIQRNGFGKSDGSLSEGYALMQDVEAKVRRITLKTRVAWYNTDNYDSRIYAYENDVLYAVSFPAYYGRGMRYYAVLRMPLTRQSDLWIRWANTTVNDREFIGSGNDQLPGNVKNDLRMQIKWNF
jgi:hypothetical protein